MTPPPSLVSPPLIKRLRSRPLAWSALIGLGMVGFSIVATLTNPDQAAYEGYLSHQALHQLQAEVCRPSPDIGLGQWVQQGCETIVQQGEAPLKQLIGYHTTRYNLGLVSVYSTELPVPTHQRQIWGIGFLGQIYVWL